MCTGEHDQRLSASGLRVRCVRVGMTNVEVYTGEHDQRRSASGLRVRCVLVSRRGGVAGWREGVFVGREYEKKKKVFFSARGWLLLVGVVVEGGGGVVGGGLPDSE